MHKVRWRNGDVVGDAHLFSLEHWIEDLCAWHWRMAGLFGLLRPPGDKRLNIEPLIRETVQAGGGRLLVKLAPMAAVTPQGRVIEIPQETLTELSTTNLLKQWVSLYVVPASEIPGTTDKVTQPAVETGKPGDPIPISTPDLYVPPVLLKASREWLVDGVEIAMVRFIERLEVKPDFIPQCVTMDSHDRLRESTTLIRDTLEHLAVASHECRVDVLKRAESAGSSNSLGILELARQIETNSRLSISTVANLPLPPLRFLQQIVDSLLAIARDAADLTAMPREELTRLEELAAKLKLGGSLFDIVVAVEGALRNLAQLLEPILHTKVLRTRAITIQNMACRQLPNKQWEYAVTLARSLGEELDQLNALRLTVSLSLREPVSTEVKIFENKTFLEIPEKRKFQLAMRDKRYEFTFEPNAVERAQAMITFFTRSQPLDHAAPSVVMTGA